MSLHVLPSLSRLALPTGTRPASRARVDGEAPTESEEQKQPQEKSPLPDLTDDLWATIVKWIPHVGEGADVCRELETLYKKYRYIHKLSEADFRIAGDVPDVVYRAGMHRMGVRTQPDNPVPPWGKTTFRECLELVCTTAFNLIGVSDTFTWDLTCEYGTGNVPPPLVDGMKDDHQIYSAVARAKANNWIHPMYGPICGWDTSRVQRMRGLFSTMDDFNQPIGDWDVRNVKTMEFMFYGASNFNQPIGGWTLSSLETTFCMFERATAFNQPLNSWNLKLVSNMAFMFCWAETFNGDISGWDTSSVKTMQYMFYQAKAFNQDISSWTVDNVKSMSYMFYKAEAFNQDISRWTTDNVENMHSMFAFAERFTSDISNWNTQMAEGRKTDMFYMCPYPHKRP